MEFLEQEFPDVDIAIAHGKVLLLFLLKTSISVLVIFTMF